LYEGTLLCTYAGSKSVKFPTTFLAMLEFGKNHFVKISAFHSYRLGDFNIGGQIIETVKFADDVVLMAKKETVLQGMIDKIIEIGR